MHTAVSAVHPFLIAPKSRLTLDAGALLSDIQFITE
jgi:hypothetical protein